MKVVLPEKFSDTEHKKKSIAETRIYCASWAKGVPGDSTMATAHPRISRVSPFVLFPKGAGATVGCATSEAEEKVESCLSGRSRETRPASSGEPQLPDLLSAPPLGDG